MNLKTNEVVVRTFTLELTEDEADVLLSIMAKLPASDRDTSCLTFKLYCALSGISPRLPGNYVTAFDTTKSYLHTTRK